MDGLQPFLDELASGSPVPGGGTVAAFEIAMAAALLSMVCNLTVGRKRYAAVEERARRALHTSQQYVRRANQLAEDDSEAYARVAAAMMLPRMNDEQRSTRSTALQIALKEAVTPPLESMQLAFQVLRLAADVAEVGNRSAISDVGVAAVSALAGFRAARFNVDINLALIHDHEWIEQVRKEIRSEREALQIETDIVDRVSRSILGDDE